MKQYIIQLDSKLALRDVYAGGKGASLARLMKQGFNVPPGFVITPSAFRDFLVEFEIQVLAQRMNWDEQDLGYIRELLLACRIPDGLAKPISQAYRRLGGRVAVRSSMVGEDTQLTSFAGQLDTILNVEGEENLLRAVRRCWASMFNWRLVSYLMAHEAGSSENLLESFSIAVVVQRMADAQVAGVAFSADPMSGQSCVVIEAAEGLGEAVVQGLVEPDRYVVDARGVLEEHSLSTADQPALEETQVLQLARMVRDAAHTAQVPQDVEWAWDGERFYLLQSRPITSLVGQKIYSNRMVSEMLPGLIKPLVWSVSTTSKLKNVLGRIFTEMIGPNDVDFIALARRIHSRIYADTTLLGHLLESMGLPANFFEIMSRDEHAEGHHPPSLTPRMIRTMYRLGRFIWHNSRAVNEIARFIGRHDQALEFYRRAQWASESSQVLLDHVDQLTNLYSETMWFNFIGPLNMMARNRMLSHIVQRWAPDVPPSDLVRGLIGLKSLESNRELMKLAAQARTLDSQLRSLLAETDDETIRRELSQTEPGRDLLTAFDAFLEQYGFLSASGTDLSRTPWSEQPTLIWHTIGRAISTDMKSKAEDALVIRESTQAQVRAKLSWPMRAIFDRVLASTITYIHLREQSSFLISEDSFEMRRIFLALGDHLVAQGDLEHREDIFYLELDEVRQLVTGALSADDAQERVSTRRAEMEYDAQIELPSTICGDQFQVCVIQLPEDQEYLVGISGSSGVTQGYAQVVLDPSEAPMVLTQEDILVVPFTDMSWTPLFSVVGGVVAETGGLLSHSAIVAREYGLPAVVNVKNATRFIKNGQPILVDGINGRVYLNHK